MKNLRTGLFFVMLALLLVFIIQNAVSVELAFLWWSFSLPRVVMLGLVFVLGMFAGNLLYHWRNLRK